MLYLVGSVDADGRFPSAVCARFTSSGHAAGTAASLAVRKGTTVQDVKAAALNAALRSEMSILDLSPQ